eukprot:1188528-Prorocentrum_minimum.AAC.5
MKLVARSANICKNLEHLNGVNGRERDVRVGQGLVASVTKVGFGFRVGFEVKVGDGTITPAGKYK